MGNRLSPSGPSFDRSTPRVEIVARPLAPGVAESAGGRGAEGGDERPLDLVVALCRALKQRRVPYCHFKSNEALDRSASGDNDLDLLVGRAGAQRFQETLAELGFKEALPPPGRRVPGVSHYYGLDAPSGRLVHVHAHSRLVFGDDTTKNFRLDIEDDYIATSVQGSLFRVPLPEYELVLFVVRMVVKHCPPDAIAMMQGKLSASEQRELVWLMERVDRRRLGDLLRTSLPWMEEGLFDRCLRAIQPGAALWTRIRTAGRLQAALAGRRRRIRGADAALRVSRRVAWGLRRLTRGPSLKRPANGGLLVALVGGDGAGKSTAVADLSAWISPPFVARTVHLGKPPPTLTTIAVKGPMFVLRRLGLLGSTVAPAYRLEASAAPFPGLPWLVWNVLTARDRFHAYRRTRRFVLAGGIVVSDRFPLPMLKTMDGSRTAWIPAVPELGRVARALIALERSYYSRIGRPDLLIVLRLDPEVAVRRRADERDLQAVRERSTEAFDADWASASAEVVDAAGTRDEVQDAVRGLLWESL